ncbi:Pyrimidine nucleotide transporter, mitochondrial [Tilletia horrida]|nr:Pyrimidine nucleotide transporter, mitochondrial [Tilletia horrida]
MCGAIITAPLDLAKTRLQSDMYAKPSISSSTGSAASLKGPVPPSSLLRQVRTLAYHFVETGQLIRQIAVIEGPRALFKGLGPTLVGVIPARSINFYTYGNGKTWLADNFNSGKETPIVHLSAAAIAGVVTATATNPIWVVKTRLQLATKAGNDAASQAATGGNGSIKSTRPLNSFQLTMRIISQEGIRGLYKGLSASMLGVAEGTIQWALYEELKRWNGIGSVAKGDSHRIGRIGERKEPGPIGRWFGTVGAAGTAKLVASLITYPHEVLRTRMRQVPEPGQPHKYTGLASTFKVVLREEGAAALYGGLSAHLLRVVPNAIVMFSIYELTLRLTAKEIIVPAERETSTISPEVITPAA